MVATHPSFESICVPLRAQLLAKAAQLCRDRGAAEDLVQDTYLNALLAWHTFCPAEGTTNEDRARAWLSRIQMNLFRDRYRSAARRAEVLESHPEEIVEETMATEAHAAPDAMLGRGGFEEFGDDRVRAAIGALREPLRDALLRTARGEDDEQIAAANNIDPRNARKRLHRARRCIADMLDGTPALRAVG